MPHRRALLAVPLATPAIAQERSVQLMVGFAPGGNIDIAARMAQPFLERYLGLGPILVVNKPGAGGLIMLNEMLGVPADGRTAALVSFPALVTALYDSAPRYRADSFAYAGLLTDEPYTIAAGPQAPWRDLGELVAEARRRPEEIAIAGAGVGGAPQLALMAFERASGARFTWVPTQGASQAMQLAQGGHVAGVVSTVSLTVPAHVQGQMRVLALLEAQRWERAPDLPTAVEQGFSTTAGSARGFALPSATPQPMQRRWEDAIRATAGDPAFRAMADRDYLIVRHMDQAAMTRFVTEQAELYGALWLSAPWRR